MSNNTPFFELCYVLLTTHAIGLEEATKKFQRYRPFATLDDMLENDHLRGELVIFKHVAKGRQGSQMVAKGFQGPRGTPGMGEMSYNQINHI